MSECYECKLVAMGKGRSAMCYDCLEERNVELQAELAALREAVRELYDDSWWHHGTRCVHDDQLTELTALQEKGE